MASVVFPGLVACVYLSETFPEESHQFAFSTEFGLLPGVNFLNCAFHLAGLLDLPKLNYKRSSHIEFKNTAPHPYKRGNFVELR